MKSKFLYFIITSLCFVGFASCSDDDDNTSIKFYDVLNEINSITVTSLDGAFIEVTNTATGPITIKSNNENIATAVRMDFTHPTEVFIHIKGVKEGKTSITITDSENKSATLQVEVVTKIQFITLGNHSISVDATNPTAENQSAIDKIKAEIENKLPPVGAGFKFTYVSDLEGKLIYYPDTKKTNEKVEGTFKLDVDETLTKNRIKLNYDNKEYIYTYGTEQSISSRVSIALPLYWIADFTDDYTQMTKPQITKAKGGMLITVDEKEFK